MKLEDILFKISVPVEDCYDTSYLVSSAQEAYGDKGIWYDRENGHIVFYISAGHALDCVSLAAEIRKGKDIIFKIVQECQEEDEDEEE
jgi:hypothetical protein